MILSRCSIPIVDTKTRVTVFAVAIQMTTLGAMLRNQWQVKLIQHIRTCTLPRRTSIIVALTHLPVLLGFLLVAGSL